SEITKITDKGLFVKIDYGIEGFLSTREAEFEGEFSDAFKEGEKVKVNVVEIDESNHNVKLSQKNKPEPPKKKKSEPRGSSRSTTTGALTLGEMSGLEDLKSKLLEKEAQEVTAESEESDEEEEGEEEKE
ncbi:MAG TPA: S1 RNA-binding domain-containing protein, partial [Balneolales bacterium]|nr:S1 RNA-binding domain-containing protein [Balneolales bacterium]